MAGLSAAQWSRVATLCSFVTPLPHHDACEHPLLLLSPNRLRLFNPAQALQAFVSRQWLKPGWSQRVARFEDLLPGVPLQRAFKAFFMALLPRALEAGRLLCRSRHAGRSKTLVGPRSAAALDDVRTPTDRGAVRRPGSARRGAPDGNLPC